MQKDLFVADETKTTDFISSSRPSFTPPQRSCSSQLLIGTENRPTPTYQLTRRLTAPNDTAYIYSAYYSVN